MGRFGIKDASEHIELRRIIFDEAELAYKNGD